MMKSKFLLLIFSLFAINISAQKLNDLKNKINQITEGKNATIAVSVRGIDFFYELNNDNASEKLPMLSVFKFHIALAVLDQVDRGKLRLDQNIFIKKSELLENTWSPIRKKYPEGNIEMPLSELIKYTVAQSDNNGCDILLRLIGGTETVQKFINEKGIADFQIKANEEEMHQSFEAMYLNFTTTEEANSLLKKFADGGIISDPSTDFLLKTMTETTTGNTKLVAQLPKGTPVAHKTGSSGKNEKGLTIAENDIGIVTLPNGKNYAISVFISDSMESEKTNTAVIAEISKLVFDYFSQK